ncbi:LysR family transcriptional regulator [Acidocella sp.]|uniref:LysR family transcriptional regulator n=1 Tax=Acidocella sp. TaxID=50710 RepID=UPI003D0761F1
MELRQLRYFEALGSTLSFSRAAEQLNIAQPPLTRQVQQLEEELGVLLIDRSKRPLRLTLAGKYFYDKAIQILSELDELRRITKQIGSGKRHNLRVGFVPSILYGDIPKVLYEFMQRHDTIDVQLFELTSVQQAQALQAGRIDVGFGRLTVPQDGLTNILVREEPLVAVIPVDGKFTAEQVTLEQLSSQSIIIYPSQPRPSFADQVLSLFRMRGLTISHTIDSNGLQTAIGLVAAGMGITVVPGSVKLLKRDDVRYVDILDPRATTPLIMMHRQRNNSEDFELFLSEFRRLGQTHRIFDTPPIPTPSVF